MPGKLWTVSGVLSQIGAKNLRMDFVFLLYVERELLKITVASTSSLQGGADAIVEKLQFWYSLRWGYQLSTSD